MTLAIYPGSFDPVTNGHVDVIQQASQAFDQLVVAVVHNPNKQPTFSMEDRMAYLRGVAAQFSNVTVDHFTGLLVDYARSKGASAIVRGLRDASDYENEVKMAQMNRKLYPEAVTVFIATNPLYAYVSSSLVKEVAKLGGDVTGLVPDTVFRGLQERFSKS